jgi:hypothetical protein
VFKKKSKKRKTGCAQEEVLVRVNGVQLAGCFADEPGPHGSAEAPSSQTPLRGADLCGCGGVAVVQRRRRRRLLPQECPSGAFPHHRLFLARPARAATCLRPVCIAQLLLFCLPPTSASQMHAGSAGHYPESYKAPVIGQRWRWISVIIICVLFIQSF